MLSHISLLALGLLALANFSFGQADRDRDSDSDLDFSDSDFSDSDFSDSDADSAHFDSDLHFRLGQEPSWEAIIDTLIDRASTLTSGAPAEPGDSAPVPAPATNNTNVIRPEWNHPNRTGALYWVCEPREDIYPSNNCMTPLERYVAASWVRRGARSLILSRNDAHLNNVHVALYFHWHDTVLHDGQVGAFCRRVPRIFLQDHIDEELPLEVGRATGRVPNPPTVDAVMATTLMRRGYALNCKLAREGRPVTKHFLGEGAMFQMECPGLNLKSWGFGQQSHELLDRVEPPLTRWLKGFAETTILKMIRRRLEQHQSTLPSTTPPYFVRLIHWLLARILSLWQRGD